MRIDAYLVISGIAYEDSGIHAVFTDKDEAVNFVSQDDILKQLDITWPIDNLNVSYVGADGRRKLIGTRFTRHDMRTLGAFQNWKGICRG